MSNNIFVIFIHRQIRALNHIRANRPIYRFKIYSYVEFFLFKIRPIIEKNQQKLFKYLNVTFALTKIFFKNKNLECINHIDRKY